MELSQPAGVGRRPAIINTVLGDIPRKQLGSSNVLGEMSTERYVEWILHDESDKKSWWTTLGFMCTVLMVDIERYSPL